LIFGDYLVVQLYLQTVSTFVKCSILIGLFQKATMLYIKK